MNETMADNAKGNLCQFNFVPKAEKLQAIHVVVLGNDVFVKEATGVGKSVCFVTLKFLMFVIFFDPSPMLVLNQSF